MTIGAPLSRYGLKSSLCLLSLPMAICFFIILCRRLESRGSCHDVDPLALSVVKLRRRSYHQLMKARLKKQENRRCCAMCVWDYFLLSWTGDEIAMNLPSTDRPRWFHKWTSHYEDRKVACGLHIKNKPG